jgi:hypothetical protein
MELINKTEMDELKNLIVNRAGYDCTEEEIRDALADLLRLMRAGHTLASSDGMYAYWLRRQVEREYLVASDGSELDGTFYDQIQRAWRRVEIAGIIVELIEAREPEPLPIDVIQGCIFAVVG